MSGTAEGTFEVTLRLGPAELDGAVSRLEMSKTFHGAFQGTGTGVMLSVGDPQVGEAGYVAIETVHGYLGEKQGSFALQQSAFMHAGSQTLHYTVIPGSGSGELRGIVGELHLDIDEDGTHHYALEYEL